MEQESGTGFLRADHRFSFINQGSTEEIKHVLSNLLPFANTSFTISIVDAKKTVIITFLNPQLSSNRRSDLPSRRCKHLSRLVVILEPGFISGGHPIEIKWLAPIVF
jgi:hypothetical protein